MGDPQWPQPPNQPADRPSDSFTEPRGYALLIREGAGGRDAKFRELRETSREQARDRALALARNYEPPAQGEIEARQIYTDGPDSFVVEVRVRGGVHVCEITVVELLESQRIGRK